MIYLESHGNKVVKHKLDPVKVLILWIPCGKTRKHQDSPGDPVD